MADMLRLAIALALAWAVPFIPGGLPVKWWHVMPNSDYAVCEAMGIRH